MIRSMLFVPADSEKKLGKVDQSGADAVILDLEDSVAPERKPMARTRLGEFLKDRESGSASPQIWVRINPLSGDSAKADIAALKGLDVDGIMLPKADGPSDVQELAARLDEVDVTRAGILPLVSETPIAPFKLGTYAEHDLPRLAGLTWGAEDLASAIGATSNRNENGDWDFTYKMVRSLTLLAAAACNVTAIDTIFANFRDLEGFEASCISARREGFSGCMAIHPAQVEIINRCFTPSDVDISEAQAIIQAFANNPGVGTVGLNGKMIDIPHKKQAEKTLARAAAFGLV